MRMFILALGAVGLLGCIGVRPASGVPASPGTNNQGWLVGGQQLPRRGPGHVLARPTDPTRWGTPTLVSALERSFASVARRFPGGAPMRVGDLSSPRGGEHPRHGSHQSGRDADLIFFLTDASGKSVQGRGWLPIDRFGSSRETRAIEGVTPSGDVFFFDAPRNWHFVRTLLLDDQARVQWIFCSRGVKARLLRHAIDHEPNPVAIARAAHVLHQPSRGRSHNDHFHVRVLCSGEERAGGCRDYGPIWPWLEHAVEIPIAGSPPDLDDSTLIRLLMEDPITDDAPGV